MVTMAAIFSSIHRKERMIGHITGNATFTQFIEVVVSPLGEVKVETKGFIGARCRQASRFLEEALGQSTGETLTAAFHQSQALGQPSTVQQH